MIYQSGNRLRAKILGNTASIIRRYSEVSCMSYNFAVTVEVNRCRANYKPLIHK